jgi:hypothetical protein
VPGKRANVKNEKQYEALKDKRDVEGARRADREFARGVEPRRQKLRLRVLAELELAGRHDGAEEGGRPEGR